MILIPSDKYIERTLQVGSVYKLVAPEFIETDIPHYFVIVAIDEDDIHMVVCTTQKCKKEAYFKIMRYNLAGLVHILPSSKNGLTDDSYIDCNQNHSTTREKLIQKKEEEILEWVGEISYSDYKQIRTGITNSTVNYLPSDLLVHPDD